MPPQSSSKPNTVQAWSIVPLPPVTPASLNGPIVLEAAYAFSPFWDTLYYATARSVWGGLVTGAVVGSIVPIIGNIIGAGIGLIIGAILGLINGLVLGALNALCFAPLTNTTRYRWTTYIVGVLTTMLTALLVCSSPEISDGGRVDGFVSFVLVCILVYSFYACHRVSEWYIGVNAPV